MTGMDDLRAKLTRAVMGRWACKPAWDINNHVQFCEAHGCGWLHDVDACARADGAADALMPIVRKACAQAWDEGHADVCIGCNCNLRRDNPWREADS